MDSRGGGSSAAVDASGVHATFPQASVRIPKSKAAEQTTVAEAPIHFRRTKISGLRNRMGEPALSAVYDEFGHPTEVPISIFAAGPLKTIRSELASHPKSNDSYSLAGASVFTNRFPSG